MDHASRATGLLTCLLAACSAAPEPRCVPSTAMDTLPAVLNEASGAVFDSTGSLWVIGDSGEPVLFGIGADNRIEARVRIADTRVRDWEDLAYGPCGSEQCLYIGDIGDNLHERSTRTILRVAQLPRRDTTVRADRFRFRYPDGPSDAEALAVLQDGSLLVITKGRNRAVGVYRYPPPLRAGEVVTLTHVQDLTQGIVQLPRQPTGATALDSDLILVRSYAQLQLYRVTADTLGAVGPPVDLRPLGESQGEGVAAGADGAIVLVGEHGGGGTIARLRCSLEPPAGTDDAP